MISKFGHDIDLSKQGKRFCPVCREEQGADHSGDNLHVYGLDSNGKHGGCRCFSCDWSYPSQQFMEDNGLEEEQEYDVVGLEFNREIYEKDIRDKTSNDPRGYRGINQKTSIFYGVRYAYDENGDVLATYYPTTTNGRMTGMKVRKHPKDFTSPYGETGKDCELFGQVKFKTFRGTVLLVGGEHDALAAFQMLENKQTNKNYNPTAVVSATIGESGAWRQVQNNYEFFNQFSKIVIAMDTDEAGRKAMEKIIEVLPRNKVFVMNMRYKDPNEYLKNGDKSSEFSNDFWAATQYVPVGVKTSANGMDEIAGELSKPRITLPPYMHRIQTAMGGGIIQGRMVNIIADTSVGKSSHVNRIGHHLIFNSPEVPTFVTLEATAGQFSLEMLAIERRDNLLWNLGEEGVIEWLESEEGRKLRHYVANKPDGSPRYYMIDERGGDITSIQEQAEMMWKQFGSKVFVFDVLTDMLRGSSAEKAEDHLSWQREMNKNGITFFNVLHTRKPTPNADGTIRRVTEYDALGTGSFVQSAAINIVLRRDKMAESLFVRNTTEVEMPKCRGGLTGEMGGWYYDWTTATCHDADDWAKEHPESVTSF